MYDNIDSYETASTLILQGETGKAVSLLQRYGSGFQTAASVAKKSKDEQLEILRDQVVNTEIQLGLLEAEFADKQESMTEEEKNEFCKPLDNPIYYKQGIARDIKYLYSVFMTLWMYVTPIFYKANVIAAKSTIAHTVIQLNPMYHFLRFFMFLDQ